jgi:hypothetical protein
MNSERKITRHSITIEEPPAFMFLGVVSSEPDYRLSVMLNRHLGIDLRKDPSDITDIREDSKYSFSRFATVTPALSLVSNRCEGITLLRKLKNIDFLIVIHGDPDKRQAEELASKVRDITEVIAVFVFDSRQISDRNTALLTE